MNEQKKSDLKALLFYTLIPLMLGFTVAMLVPDFKEFYQCLKKPIDVPSLVFPIVWSILYILMGVSAYLVDKSCPVTKPLKLYYCQLLVNLAWTPVFFGAKLLTVGAIHAVVLSILVIINAIQFYKVNKLSGLLMIPYILWSIFASYLAIQIAIMN